MRAAIYARVSTTDKGQDPDLQIRPLREYCAAREYTVVGPFVDHISGAKESRPELDKLLDLARKRQIDCVIVWKFDRFARSLKHLITAIDELDHLGVTFISFSENIDMSSASGRLFMQIFGALAEFERSMIRERVKAGIENAKRKGKKVGRRPLAPIDNKTVIQGHKADPELSVRELAGKLKTKISTTGRILKLYKDGKLDEDGFPYATPLFPVSKTPQKRRGKNGGNRLFQ